MHLVELVNDMKTALEELFKDYEYETKSGSRKSPDIRTGWYVKKKKEEDFPYILVSPANQNDLEENSKVKLYLVIGVYSEEESGWQDVGLIMNKIRLYLRSRNVFAKRYGIDKNLKMSYPDDQPYPQWFGVMEVNFDVYNIADTSIDFDNFDDFEL